ncbi:hypothetical protein PTSG_12680 [Salpingoeca rosetta]|uniref:Kri1-like C-terminal domain-containing protein n=1 Tax=Salpingoeca rosetta (strain ATCC 50818 / BSB-021) TaxID=946362 RepID=F2UI17_SALR5|nr:uncharacterized protein PTSG_12680 [Salpingoeca rosetta]EGD76766.1 hypothetical protein PTSG_12680 [Salpingoeca rosetta]|eukprot:XP_004991138.1 hypothetical protein PTSG_12680 [Salpingoeca rosetta]
MPRKKSKKVDLIDEEGDNLGFELDKEFEKRFEYNQKRKELHRLQEKYGDTADLESSDEESEDEDAEADTPATERGFLRTLSLLKGNVPQLLDTKEPLYEEDDSQEGGDGDNDDEEKNEKKKKKKDKPMTLKDHERRRILTRQTDAMLSDDDEEEIGKATGENADDLRTQFALEGGDDDDDVDALLQKKEISTEEKEKQQADYLEWLQGREIELNRKMKAELQPLRRYWTDNTLSSEDKFLRDYITRRMWRNDGGEDDDTINYFDPEVDNEDDEHVERTEEYERQYNFRFEEPGATEIKSYPRVIAASARREKDTRKAARQRKKERKELEKKQKEEEISRLKKLKREQIKAKLRQIAEISGHDPAALEGLDLDLDAEFDPDKFNQQLEKLFNDDYYGDEEKKKPKLPEDVDAAVFDDAYPPVPEAGEGYGEEGGEAYEGYGEEGYEGHGEEGYEGGADGYEGHGEEGYDGGDGSFAPVPEGEAATTAVSLEEGAKTLQHLSKRQRKKLERQRRREAKQKAKKGVITDLQTQDDVHVDDTKTVND